MSIKYLLLLLALVISLVIGIPLFVFIGFGAAFAGGDGAEIFSYPLLFLIGVIGLFLYTRNKLFAERVRKQAVLDKEELRQSDLGVTEEDKILAIVQKRESVTVKELQQLLRTDKDVVMSTVRKLMKEGRLEQELTPEGAVLRLPGQKEGPGA